MQERSQFAISRREKKFPLAPGTWDQAVRCAERHLPIERFDGVHSIVNVRTTYLDTAELDSYREYREARPVRRKIRIRQYGYDGQFNGRCWVEIKIKRYKACLKRRFCCDADALMEMMSGQDIRQHVERINNRCQEACDIYEAVRSHISKRNLRPVVCVDYERMAFEAGDSAAHRITVDRCVSFRDARASVSKTYDGTVVEVKYREREPEWLAEFLQALGVPATTRFSKYARAVRDLGVNGNG